MSSDIGNPLVSYCLFAYNQTDYVRAAVESALRQTYSPLEIIISDDASTDDTFDVIKEIVSAYRGKHKVHINRNCVNLGLIEHVNKMFGMSTGELVVLAAGDDIALPRRTELLVQRWLGTGKKAMAVCSGYREIDSGGNPVRIRDVKAFLKSGGGTLKNERMFWFGCAPAYARFLFERFGPIRYPTTEDTVFYRRALMCGGVDYVDEPLVDYRIGVGISTRKSKSPVIKRIRKLNWQVNLARQMLADFEKTEISQTRKDILLWWCKYLKKKELQLSLIEEFVFSRKLKNYLKLLVAFPLLGVRRIVFLFIYPPIPKDITPKEESG